MRMEIVKMKKQIILGAIICILLVGIGITIIFVAKYKEEHRYLTYEELGPEQIILAQEWHERYNGEIIVKVNIVDKTGNKYSALIPEQEWEGIESFIMEMSDAKKTLNCLSTDDTEHMYNCIIHMNSEAGYKSIPQSVPCIHPLPYRESFSYGIRNKKDGTSELVLIWKEEGLGNCYILDDEYANKIWYKLDYLL